MIRGAAAIDALHQFLRPFRHRRHHSLLFARPFSEAPEPPPTDAADLLRRWGCSDAEVSQILDRQPALLRMKLPLLQSKLDVLRSAAGIYGPDLARIISTRPRFLSSRLGPDLLDRRLPFLRTLFPSPSLLHLALLRNPYLLTYDVDRLLRPCADLYDSLGVSRPDLGRLLISRPSIVPRSALDPDKLDLLRRTLLPPSAPMYKYAAAILAISRLDTIHTKIANLERCGLAADEAMALFAKTPNVLTFSADKVQRNMTYITGTMRLPARAVLDEPKLLYCNLEKVLKPRYLVCEKLRGMGLEPGVKGMTVTSAVRMVETRFLKVFVSCHNEEDAEALMEVYTRAKGLRRLAESSKSAACKGFPF